MKLLAFLVCLSVLLGDASGAEKAADEKVWELTSYLKGTAPQIRDLLNGDLERLVRTRREAKQEILDTAEAAKKAEAAAIERLHARKRYVQLKQALDDADQKRVTARKDATPEIRLEAAAAFIKRKQELDAYERDSLASDEDLVRARTSSQNAQEHLIHCEASLGRAFEWRQRLVDVLRNSFILSWPLDTGQVGLLGIVTPTEIDKAREAIAFEFDANETIREEKVQEEISTLRVHVHKVSVIAIGLDTGGMQVGHPTRLDRAFKVVSSRFDGNLNQYFIVKRFPGDLDRLFELMADLREPIDFTELATLADSKQVPSKPHPKTWTSIPAILAGAPKPTATNSDSSAQVANLNDWLDAQIVGDKLESYVTVDDATPQGDGGLELRAHVSAGIGKSHTVICTVSAPSSGKVKAVKAGQKLRVTGTIKIIRSQGSELFYVQLSETRIGDATDNRSRPTPPGRRG